jgi:hypothetical protein
VVADVLRLDKGQAEGLEPKVAETVIRRIVSAPAGKIAHGGEGGCGRRRPWPHWSRTPARARSPR